MQHLNPLPLCLRVSLFFGLYFVTLYFITTPLCFAQINQAAFYYGPAPPTEELHQYDVVVVQPQQHFNPKQFDTPQNQAFAYVSVGEINKNTKLAKQIPKNWIVGQNKAWNSEIIDQTDPAWREFFIQKIITPLWNKGYRGFFLDTLDSYKLAYTKFAQQQAQQQAIIQLIQAIKQKYPQAKLILNRGFELLPEIHSLIYAIAAESLLHTWKQSGQGYKATSKQHQEKLIKKLNKIKSMGIPVIVIDYVAPGNFTLAQQTANRIKHLGFVAWIADKDLTLLHASMPFEPIKRKILVLYSSIDAPDINESNAVAKIAMPLEYLGFVPILHDMHRSLPPGNLKHKYAGIIIWLEKNHPMRAKRLQNWMLHQIHNGIHMAVFGSFGFQLEEKNAAAFGIQVNTATHNPHIIRISHRAPIIGFETPPIKRPNQFFPITLKRGKALLQYTDGTGAKSDVIAITPWGGYALLPYMLDELPNDHTRWILNPFKFLQQALRLPKIPIPDTTTENGRRLMLAHIDGDSFISRAEWFKTPFAGKVMLEEVLKRYQIPTTVSIVQGEIANNGLYPQYAQITEAIAREIFKLPWVEIASHSYSHPFDWFKIENNPSKAYQNKWNLPIKNYRFNLKDEITGSVEYINKNLAPPGKSCKVFLWTGNTNPSTQAVALTYKDGLKNMNGGNTIINYAQPTLTSVSPLGVNHGKYFQVYAPIQNEVYYTNSWLGPFYGFERVIETLKLTNKPRRLKPIDIYYHFYSATKRSALHALKKVYDWSLKQNVFNIYVSEYVDKVLDFNHLLIGRKEDGYWLINHSQLRELRVPQSFGYPDLKQSKNIVGFSAYGKDYYVHLGPRKESFIRFTSQKPTVPYLVSANARLTYFKRNKKGLVLGLSGHLPLKLTFGNMRGCSAWLQNKKRPGTRDRDGNTVTLNLKQEQINALSIRCQPGQWPE